MTPMLGIMASSISGSKISTSSYESIATVTATGVETTISFTSIPSTYKHLQLRGIGRSVTTAFGATSVNYIFKLNSDATSANYRSHYLVGNTSTAAAGSNSGYAGMFINGGAVSAGTTAGTYGAVIIDFIDYASTTKNKTVKAITGQDFNTASTYQGINLDSGVWINTAAVTSISFVNDDPAAYAAGSTWALYGIKG